MVAFSEQNSVGDGCDVGPRRLRSDHFRSQDHGWAGVIRGLRIPVSVIVGQIAGGASAEQLLADYPDLEAEDIQQALAYAAWLSREEVIPA
ncbi:MAG TPA: DUF433 domain-containing protein [Geminicoccaceae bacterium]|nr:DUF433 domain-containing protein [Geminicoccaceae bacterium]